MSKFFYALTIAALAELSVVTVPARAANAIVIAGDEAGRIVSLRTKSINNHEVSGEVVNNSPDVLRNVVLEIRYSWRWKDESWQRGSGDHRLSHRRDGNTTGRKRALRV